jgi:hypothetical protein
MVRVRRPCPVPAKLLAEIVTAAVTALVGVPLMIPVVEFTLNPPGRPLASNEVGLLLAVIV